MKKGQETTPTMFDLYALLEELFGRKKASNIKNAARKYRRDQPDYYVGIMIAEIRRTRKENTSNAAIIRGLKQQLDRERQLSFVFYPKKEVVGVERRN